MKAEPLPLSAAIHDKAARLDDDQRVIVPVVQFSIVVGKGSSPTSSGSEDIYPTRSLDGNALIQPASREAFQCLLAQGWSDSLSQLHPEGPLWTFWDYMRGCWAADKGMRLDHLSVSPNLKARLADAGVDRWMRGEQGASDHAPAWIRLAP